MSESNSNDLTIHEITITKDITLSYYFSKGTTDFTIVLIHGLGATKEDFLSIFNYEELSTYNILFADLVGYGNSTKPSDFSYKMDDQAEILYELLKKLKIEGEIVILAHSMGGPISIELANLLGDRVAGMIYAEGNLDEGDCFFSKQIVTRYTLDEWISNGFNEILTKLQEDPASTSYAESFAKAEVHAIYKSSEDLYQISIANLLEKKLKQLSVPVLAIFGEKNKGRFSSESKLAAEFPVCYISEAEHAMMYDNPDDFYQAIIDFLKQF
ncbi:MAG: alpha/beta hydrolase [Candidatus Heimdallarchaeota archaeon]